MITYIEALARIAEKTNDNTRDIRQKNRQRRTEVTDLFGVEYTRQGDGGSPATFYVSISPDMIYLERFACKLIIQPFVSTVSGGTQSATVSVQPQRLTIGEDNSLEPNPHSHDTAPHSHTLVSGITLTNTQADDFTVNVAGVNVTPYLMAQMDGEWIDGEGIYPDARLGTDDDWFDFLQVASDLEAEGNDEAAQKLLSPGYKRISITSANPFNVTYVSYLKFSHMNR